MTTRRTNLLDVTGALLTAGIWISVLAMLGTLVVLAWGLPSGTPAEIPPALPPEKLLLAERIHLVAQLLCAALALRVLSNAYPGVFTALPIFVLARIFDTGTRMRTEIQETV